MYTFQDLKFVGDDEVKRADFVHSVITDHKSSEMYLTALDAEDYARHKNVTINNFQKMLYTVKGNKIPDEWSANYKMACRHFYRFITQENQFLLGNGVTWENEETANKLGTKDKPFDNQLQKAGLKALKGGVAFGLYDLDHVEVFGVTEFAPLRDEENGSLKAGVRFWQIANNKPLRGKLYEIDGYTDYIWYSDEKLELGDEWEVLREGLAYKKKRAYIIKTQSTTADGDIIYEGENYPTFPIVPLWGNQEHQSELIGLREQIDAYDLIKSGFCNTVDDASIIYWTMTNAGGMEDIDLAKFVERLKKVHAVNVDEDINLQSHSIEAPYASREALLDRLDKDLYRDAMALDTESIAGGAVTATQIKAAYEPLNAKCDMYEYCVNDFVNGIMKIAGVEDEFSFTRSMLINVNEDVQTLSQAAAYLPEDYVVTKMLTILGDGDKAEKIIKEMQADELPKIEETETEE